jgi:hypothetical protein
MKVFRVTGWRQYKRDCASRVDRVHIADTAAEAIEDAKNFYDNKDVRYLLNAEEIAVS